MRVLVALSVQSSVIGGSKLNRLLVSQAASRLAAMYRVLVTWDLILDAKAQGIEPKHEPEIDLNIGAGSLMEVSLVQELSGLSLEEIRRYNHVFGPGLHRSGALSIGAPVIVQGFSTRLVMSQSAIT